jgi:hypothetical protein
VRPQIDVRFQALNQLRIERDSTNDQTGKSQLGNGEWANANLEIARAWARNNLNC